MKCKHPITKVFQWRRALLADQPNLVMTSRHCDVCRAWLSLGPSNDKPSAVRVEIAAARLFAGWWTGNDTDDTHADPIAAELLNRWIGDGQGPRSREAAQCEHLHDVAVEDGVIDLPAEDA